MTGKLPAKVKSTKRKKYDVEIPASAPSDVAAPSVNSETKSDAFSSAEKALGEELRQKTLETTKVFKEIAERHGVALKVEYSFAFLGTIK